MGLAWPTLAALVVGFLLGSINPAFLFARAMGLDLRQQGSGNAGATNAGRVLGVRWGVLVGVLDVLKGYLPALLAAHLFGLPAALACGLGVVLGHMFSPFLGGRGGKGVATALGVLLALAWPAALVALVIFGITVGLTKVVGMASILASCGLCLVGIAEGLRLVSWSGPMVGWWTTGIAVLVLARHHRNLRAWWRGLR